MIQPKVPTRITGWTTAYLVIYTLHSWSIPTSYQLPRKGQHVDEWQYRKWPFPKRLLIGMVRNADTYSSTSIFPFYIAYKTGSWWQQAREITPDDILLNHVFQLFLGDPEVSSSQLGYLIIQACYESAHNWSYQKYLHMEEYWSNTYLPTVSFQCEGATVLLWAPIKYLTSSLWMSGSWWTVCVCDLILSFSVHGHTAGEGLKVE